MEAQLLKMLGSFGPSFWLILGAVVLGYIKVWPKLKELAQSHEKSTIIRLEERLSKLEYELEVERSSRTVDVAILRHRLANADHALDIFIELVEAQPERAAYFVERIKKRREQDRDREAIEAAAIRAAELYAVRINAARADAGRTPSGTAAGTVTADAETSS